MILLQELKHAFHMTKAGMEFMKSRFSEEVGSLGKIGRYVQVLLVIRYFKT